MLLSDTLNALKWNFESKVQSGMFTFLGTLGGEKKKKRYQLKFVDCQFVYKKLLFGNSNLIERFFLIEVSPKGET